jgi:hypothetical protein
LWQQPRGTLPVLSAGTAKRNDARVTTTTPARNLERIAAPKLAINAKDDLYSAAGGAKYAAEQIPGAMQWSVMKSRPFRDGRLHLSNEWTALGRPIRDAAIGQFQSFDQSDVANFLAPAPRAL